MKTKETNRFTFLIEQDGIGDTIQEAWEEAKVELSSRLPNIAHDTPVCSSVVNVEICGDCLMMLDECECERPITGSQITEALQLVWNKLYQTTEHDQAICDKIVQLMEAIRKHGVQDD